jgi:hypothetical protein
LIERTSASVGCEQTMTFDVSAAKYAGMTLIQKVIYQTAPQPKTADTKKSKQKTMETT